MHPVRAGVVAGPEQQHLGVVVGGAELAHRVVDVLAAQADHLLQRFVVAGLLDRSFVADQPGERVGDQPLVLGQVVGQHPAGRDQHRTSGGSSRCFGHGA